MGEDWGRIGVQAFSRMVLTLPLASAVAVGGAVFFIIEFIRSGS